MSLSQKWVVLLNPQNADESETDLVTDENLVGCVGYCTGDQPTYLRVRFYSPNLVRDLDKRMFVPLYTLVLQFAVGLVGALSMANLAGVLLGTWEPVLFIFISVLLSVGLLVVYSLPPYPHLRSISQWLKFRKSR